MNIHYIKVNNNIIIIVERLSTRQGIEYQSAYVYIIKRRLSRKVPKIYFIVLNCFTRDVDNLGIFPDFSVHIYYGKNMLCFHLPTWKWGNVTSSEGYGYTQSLFPGGGGGGGM